MEITRVDSVHGRAYRVLGAGGECFIAAESKSPVRGTPLGYSLYVVQPDGGLLRADGWCCDAACARTTLTRLYKLSVKGAELCAAFIAKHYQPIDYGEAGCAVALAMLAVTEGYSYQPVDTIGAAA